LLFNHGTSAIFLGPTLAITDYANYQAKKVTGGKSQKPRQVQERLQGLEPRSSIDVVESSASDTFIGKVKRFWDSHG
jgi:hypothetical protein